MKILFISMLSIHAVRWIENLKETPFQLYWFDVLNRGKLHTFEDVHQFSNWKKRKLPYIKGEFFLSRNLPRFYNYLQPYLEVTASEKLKEILIEVQPDVVHSFEMQSCSYPILRTMQKFPDIKWVYSCWGSDLFYYKNITSHHKRIRKVLQRIDILQTDNQRDIKIAYELGFKGKNTFVIPGGGGYSLNNFSKLREPLVKRNIILVKGYQHKFGRALVALEALKELRDNLEEYEIVVFAAHQEVIDYINENQLPFKVFGRNSLSNEEVIKLMGKSIIYLGNSISDGIPNTLLEALIMGAFPIQCNPGNVTEELIDDGINGFLINNPEDEKEIKELILQALGNIQNLWVQAYRINRKITKKQFDYTQINKHIVNLYKI